MRQYFKLAGISLGINIVALTIGWLVEAIWDPFKLTVVAGSFYFSYFFLSAAVWSMLYLHRAKQLLKTSEIVWVGVAGVAISIGSLLLEIWILALVVTDENQVTTGLGVVWQFLWGRVVGIIPYYLLQGLTVTAGLTLGQWIGQKFEKKI